jgi:subtilisin family serine protease
VRRSLSPCRDPRIVALLGLAAWASLTVAAPAAPPASDTVLVKIDPAAGPGERAAIADALDAGASAGLPAGWRRYSLPEAVTAAGARAELAGADGALRVQLPSRLRPAGTVPDDPLFGPVDGGYQWGLRNTGAWSGGMPGADIDALEGWAAQRTAAPVTVAVIDTGVDLAHPDLAGRAWTNPGEVAGNGVDDDGDGRVDDVNGWDFANHDASLYDDGGDAHGTHVAGIVAARRGNGAGVAGVADNARIMSLKFIGNGSGWNYDAISAIQYAVTHGARVINASWGGGTYDAALCDAVSWAAARGTVFVVAAGNGGADLDAQPTWPARCPEPSALTVAAFTHTGALASFSNRSAAYVDIAAPGQYIVSTLPAGAYGHMSGTSMATPFVAGAAAAVLGEAPGLTAPQVRQALLAGGVPLASLAGTTSSGRRVDLAGALAAAGAVPPPSAAAPPADTTAPAAPVPLAPAGDAAVPTATPLFTWAAAGDDTGVAGYRLVLDGVVRTTTAALAAQAGPLTAGPHTWRVEALDGAGNVSRSAERRLVVDTTPPAAFSLLAPAAGSRLRSGTATVRWTRTSDAVSGLVRHDVLVDGRVVGIAAPTAVAAPVTLAPGAHRIAVRAVDEAGNARQTAARAVTVVAPARATGLTVVVRRGRMTLRTARAGTVRVRVADRRTRGLVSVVVRLHRGETAVPMAAAVARGVGEGRYTVSVARLG